MTRLTALISLLLLPACQGPAMPEPPRLPDLAQGVRSERPAAEPGQCWAGEESRWFQAPCPDAMTPERVATLQRALEVRGLHKGAISGEMDKATRAAIRRFQEPLGLDSDRLSIEAARYLGVVPVELDLPEPEEEEAPGDPASA
ncbi:peptidoglycan-binding domain-containing protein [Cereibacter sediminicola]|uniref:peptidoglycan-binding domain-containing protein n=1 Tax=Cereibacter sediminicola TaxID=2584941 RepID=UPI0011A134E3|nr:peptidoglycan-binding domain-containing protein [Cereibacter sediminicola]